MALFPGPAGRHMGGGGVQGRGLIATFLSPGIRESRPFNKWL